MAGRELAPLSEYDTNFGNGCRRRADCAGAVVYSCRSVDRARDFGKGCRCHQISCQHDQDDDGCFGIGTAASRWAGCYPDAANTEDCPLGIVKGDVFTRDEIVGGMLMVSDNGAAVALADSIDGSVPAFAKRMNARAKELGMEHTHFDNPNGLTVPTHYSTARDMMKLARYAMENETFRKMVARKNGIVHWSHPVGKTFRVNNTNELLGSYPGAVGIKTGWTGESGGCLAAEAKRNGADLLVILMASPTPAGRFTDARALLDYGFSQVKMADGPKAEETKRTVWVKDGKSCRTEVKAAHDIRYPLIHGEDVSRYSIAYDVPQVISAKDIKNGVAGHIIIQYDGQPVGSVDMKTEPVEPGFSVSSWLVGAASWLMGW